MEERRRRSNNLNETSEPAAQFLCVCCELVSLALFLRFFGFLGLLSIACRKRGSACEISEMSQKPEMRQVCILNLVTSKKMKERDREIVSENPGESSETSLGALRQRHGPHGRHRRQDGRWRAIFESDSDARHSRQFPRPKMIPSAVSQSTISIAIVPQLSAE